MDDRQLKTDILLARCSMYLGVANAVIVPIYQVGMWLRDGRWTSLTPRSLSRFDLTGWQDETMPAMIANTLFDTPLAVFTLVFGGTWWFVSRAMFNASTAALRKREALERAVLGG